MVDALNRGLHPLLDLCRLCSSFKTKVSSLNSLARIAVSEFLHLGALVEYSEPCQRLGKDVYESVWVNNGEVSWWFACFAVIEDKGIAKVKLPECLMASPVSSTRHPQPQHVPSPTPYALCLPSFPINASSQLPRTFPHFGLDITQTGVSSPSVVLHLGALVNYSEPFLIKCHTASGL